MAGKGIAKYSMVALKAGSASCSVAARIRCSVQATKYPTNKTPLTLRGVAIDKHRPTRNRNRNRYGNIKCNSRAGSGNAVTCHQAAPRMRKVRPSTKKMRIIVCD